MAKLNPLKIQKARALSEHDQNAAGARDWFSALSEQEKNINSHFFLRLIKDPPAVIGLMCATGNTRTLEIIGKLAFQQFAQLIVDHDGFEEGACDEENPDSICP